MSNPESNTAVYKRKVVADYEVLAKLIEAHKTLGNKVVATIGSWDLLHIGHLRYLIAARNIGDVLVVGTDSDRAIKLYKKTPLRPVVPQAERMEMLSYQTCVDYTTLIDDVDDSGNWQFGLLKAIKPDVFIAVEDSYPEEQRIAIKQYCDELNILPRQAENTSTSNFIQNTVKRHLEVLLAEATRRL